MTGTWSRGTPVRVKLDAGLEVVGQVWSEASIEGAVWLALDNGTFLLAKTSTGDVCAADAFGRVGARLGRVA